MRRSASILLPLIFATAASARILVVGDSNAIGLGVAPELAWPMRLMHALNEPVQVYGAPGAALVAPFPLGIAVNTYLTPGPTPSVAEQTGDGPSGEKIIQGVVGLRCAVLALGTNDAGQQVTGDAIRAAVAAILAPIQAPWICITPPGVINETSRRLTGITMADVRAAIAAECTARGAQVIDGAALLPAKTSLQPDGRHLAASAHALLSKHVAERIEAVCPRKVDGGMIAPGGQFR
jgi:lysophospholipase L1-like esterase